MRMFKNKWPAGKSSRNLLFFAQVAAELTDYNSWDNYRAYTLDTSARIIDLAAVSRRVEQDEVSKNFLKSVKAESSWSLNNDPIAKKALGEDLEIYLKFLTDQEASLSDIKYRSDHLSEGLLKSYQASAEFLIIETCNEDGKKFEIRKKLKQLTACYCSFLLCRGYSQEFIAQKVQEHFFTYDQKRYSEKQLKDFFQNFDDKKKKYRIYIKLQNKYAQFLDEYFGFKIVKLSELSKSCKQDSFFKKAPKKKVLDIGVTEALDPFKAGEKTQTILQALKAFTWLEPIEFNLKWDKTMVAHRVGSRDVCKVIKSQPSLKQRKPDVLGGAEDKYALLVSKVFGQKCLSPSSWVKLIRSVDTFSQALDAKESDTRLVSMWASLEALMSDKKRSKIHHYDKYLVAAICEDYVSRNFEAAYKDLYYIYKDKLLSIIKKNKGSRKDNLRKFCEIVLLRKNEAIRLELINLTKNNPLATYRLKELNEKFSDPRKSLDAYVAHRRRVEWQIDRIYRVRNDIVHTANSSEYTDNLILNLDTYYRAIIKSIAKQLDENNQKDLDRIFSDIYLRQEQKLHRLANKGLQEEGLVKIIL